MHADPIPAATAVFFRNGDPHHAEFGHLPYNIVGIFTGLFNFLCAGYDYFPGELPAHSADHFMLFGQIKVQFGAPFGFQFKSPL
jgi:hypothetical protein